MTNFSAIEWIIYIPVVIFAASWVWGLWDKAPAKVLGPLLLLSAVFAVRTGQSLWTAGFFILVGSLLSAYALMSYSRERRERQEYLESNRTLDPLKPNTGKKD